MHHFVMSFLVQPTISGAEAAKFILRWFHLIAGITWIGLLYFFNLVNVPFMKTVDAAVKPKIFENMTLPALNWFRWSALVTVFLGFWYWGQFLVAPDAQRDGGSSGKTQGLFLLIWIVAFFLLYFVITKVTPNGYVLGAIVAVLVYAAGWLFVHYTPVGGDDNHVLCIGVGGGFGIVMLFNVWGIIWPNNKKIIRGTLAGTPPANAAALARQAFLASRTNFFLSVPMLFYMAAASHFGSTVIFGK
jgi:uncharacterized membrane protein